MVQGERVSGVYDVVVIGSGIMGSCIAYQVAKRGSSVILIEQFDFLHRKGSSHGESRTIRLTYPEEYYTGMVKEAFQLWEEAQQEAGYRVHTKTVHLDIGPLANKSLQAVITSCKKHDIKVDLLTPDETAKRFPVFELPSDWIAVVTPQGGVLHATKAVAMFQLLASRNGAVLCDRNKVKKICPCWKLPDGNDGVLVTANNGSVLGRKCVIAAGAWTAKLVKEISGLDLPIQPLHTTIAYWQIDEKNLDAFSVANGFPTFACYTDPYVYGTPSIEYPGLIKISLHGGYSCDPENRPFLPDVAAAKKLVGPWIATHFKGKVRQEFPVLADPCLYSVTPDEDYIIDFLPLKFGEQGSVLVAGGFSGHGFKMGPLVGRVMADLAIHGDSPGIPLEHFSINRFLRAPGGNRKDFGDPALPVRM
eukprot:c20453_g1_i1 orf=513-1769(-)